MNFHSDKKEILPIENIGSEDNSLDVLLTNLLMFFDYYDVSVTKEELLERIHFEKLYEKILWMINFFISWFTNYEYSI